MVGIDRIKCITAGVMTGTDVLTGSACNVKRAGSCSFQAKWTGTPNGTFSFEISNDNDPVNSSDLGWTTLTEPADFTDGDPVGTATSYTFEFVDITWSWIRIKYTNASSTGTLNVVFNGKASE